MRDPMSEAGLGVPWEAIETAPGDLADDKRSTEAGAGLSAALGLLLVLCVVGAVGSCVFGRGL